MFNFFSFFTIKPFLLKIKVCILGRVFRWNLFKNKISFFFLHSNHEKLFVLKKKKVRVVKTSKTGIIFFFFFFLKKNNITSPFKLIKKLNLFTKRGILVKNSMILKKKGKTSSYSSKTFNSFIYFKKIKKPFNVGFLKFKKNKFICNHFYIFDFLQPLDFFFLKKKKEICFLSMDLFFVEIRIPLNEPTLKTNSCVLKIFEWYEREIKEFDFFKFKGLKDSRPLLTSYNSKILKKKNLFLKFNFFFKKLFFLKKNKIKL